MLDHDERRVTTERGGVIDTTRRLPDLGALAREPLGRLNVANFLLSITIYSPILVLFYTGRGLSLFQILSLESFMGLAGLVLEVPTGVVADRVGLRRSVVLGFAFQVVWLLILMAAHAYWLFLAGYAVLGLAVTFRSGATEAWIYETLKADGRLDQMSRAQGSFWSASLVGRIASALLTVVVVRAMTERYFLLAFALSAVAMALGTLLVLTIPNRQPDRERSRAAGGWRLVQQGWRLVRHQPRLRRIVALEVLSDPLPYALLFLYQPYFQRSGTPTALYGLAAAAGAGLGALAAHRSHTLEARFGTRRTFAAANLLPVAGYLLMAAFAGPYLAALLYVATYGVMQLRYPLIATMRNRHITSYNRATALSVIAMLEGAYGMVMRLVAGYLADVNLSLAFGALALVPLLAVLVLPLREEHLVPAEPQPA